MNKLLRHLPSLPLLALVACSGQVVDSPADEVDTLTTELRATDDLVATQAGAAAVATQAYIYGYPALLMDRTRFGSTAVAHPDIYGAPANQLFHVNTIPDHTFRLVVRPNRDTIYSASFLDLQQEPMVLHVPAVDSDRFIMFTFLDAWTNAFASPGTCQDQREQAEINAERTLFITGPNYEGPVPAGYTHIQAPTDQVWMLGRVELFSLDDLENVKAIQAQLDLRPLSAVGDASWTAPPGTLTPEQSAFVADYPDRSALPDPQQNIQDMDAKAFFGLLAEILLTQPGGGDEEMLGDLASIGVRPGSFDYDSLPLYLRLGLEEGIALGQAAIDASKRLAASGPEPWGPPASVPLGDYGDQYLVRAVVAQVGFGANRREDAVYMNTARDKSGLQLNGRWSQYVLHLPPELACASGADNCAANAFWSLSIYDSEGYFVDNPIGRYLLGSHDSLTLEADGSLKLYLQATPPEDPQVNWLPIPTEAFEATMRIYCPSPSVINGSWVMPGIERSRLLDTL